MTDKEREDYFDKYWDLFASSGWKQFIEDLNDSAKSLDDICTIKDANEFFYRKGQVEILRRVLNFQRTMEESYKEIENE